MNGRLTAGAFAVVLLVGCANAYLLGPSAPNTTGGGILASRVAHAAFVGSHLYVADADKNRITVFDLRSHKIVRTITQGIDVPEGVAFDDAGNLYVANIHGASHKGTSITVYPSGSGNLALTIRRGINGPGAMVFDSSENLYVSNSYSGKVTVYAPGENGPLRTISSGVSRPRGMAFDRSGNLYVANSYPPSVTVYAPGSGTPMRTITTALTGPVSLAFDAGGKLYVANCSHYAASSIAIYSADQNKLIDTISDGLVCAGKLALSPANELYVKDFDASDVMVYALGGEHRLLRKISAGVNRPTGTAFDGAGNLYVANCGNCGAVGRSTVTVYGPRSDRPRDRIRQGVSKVSGIAIGP